MKVFKLIPKIAHLTPVPPVQAEEEEFSTEKQVRDLLFRFELAEQARLKLAEVHSDLFDHLARLDAEQAEVKDALKRLLHTKNGPPAQVRPGSSSHIWARGDYYYVEVVYKKKSNYYNPAALPPAVFTMPGVVTEVDKGVLDHLAKKDGRIARALVQGEFMTPSVSIRRAERENQSSSHGDESNEP